MEKDFGFENIYREFANNDLNFEVHRGTHRKLAYRHYHDYYQLWYIVKGSFVHLIDGKAFVQRKGDLFLIPSYVNHQMDTRNSIDVEWIFVDMADNFLDLFPGGFEKNKVFNMTCLRPLVYNSKSAEPFIHYEGEKAKEIEAMFDELLNEYNSGSELAPVYIRAKIVQLLSRVAEDYTSKIPEFEEKCFSNYRMAIRTVIDFVNLHYTEDLSCDDIYRIALMSKTSFNYIFKQAVGKTLVDYINMLRIRMAKKLLKEGNLNVTRISEECGFKSATYFGRVFKKETGFTPKEYAYLKRNDK
ncbi:MAG: helix-turn-helix domain-containing protein [Ruminococcaceae bacterium]|nr:helix-turn-helix domain-containing protein [Oscillospiraceae bacterium]